MTFDEKLKSIVGAAHVRTAPAERALYAYDATPIADLVMPDAVVLPASAEEVAALLGLANELGMSVVARGAGTNVTGGTRPVQGGLVISTQRMNRILDLDVDNLQAVVQPGVVTEDLQEAAEAVGLFYPPDPQSAETCTIGGNLAENAGGPRAVKYGVTRHYVLALQAAMADGRLLRFGARTLKSVVGYDMTSLLVGSEGTLAFITEATLRLIPQPEARGTLLAVFSEVEQAAAAVASVLQAGNLPAALEFVDQTALQALPPDLGLPAEAAALLVLEVDGSKTEVAASGARVAACLNESGALRVDLTEDAGEADRLWQARRAVGPALAKIAPLKINEDVVVPISRLPDAVRRIRAIADSYSIRCAIFGHAGDGNLHVNFLLDQGDQEGLLRVRDAVAKTFEVVVDLGGSISGEHGIGTAKQAFVGLELEPSVIELMRAVKQVFDPKGIMNPGKIF